MELLVLAVALLAAPAAYARAVYSTLEDLGALTDVFSPLLKVTKSTDIADHDAIYYTPPVYFVGDKTGKILRCLQEDRNTCEVFYRGSGGIRRILLYMEHLYAADDKTLVKCESHNARSCRTIFTCDTYILALEIDNSNLYMGLQNGTILLCQLTEPTTCRIFHTFDDMVTSLKQIDSHIYAGLKSGHIMRCSLFAYLQCTLMYRLTGTYVLSLTKFENHIIGVTYDNRRWWNCSLAPNLSGCAYAEFNFNPLDVVRFNSTKYILETEKAIHKCKWGNKIICSKYAYQEGYSMAFLYGTYRLQSRYTDEQRACTWQSGSKCPPFVTYYALSKATFKVYVKDGKLYNSVGDLVDTSDADEGQSGPAAIFVMAPDGTLLLSNSHKKELLHTSSLLAGYPASAAGEMVVEQGVIKNITACSRHYHPDITLNHQLVDSLRSQGYTEAFDSEPCPADNMCGVVTMDISYDYDVQTVGSSPSEADIEAGTEASTEARTEARSEASTEARSETDTEADTEASTEPDSKTCENEMCGMSVTDSNNNVEQENALVAYLDFSTHKDVID